MSISSAKIRSSGDTRAGTPGGQKVSEGTDKTIREIAYFLDFTESSHFSKFFKKMTGMTPSSYGNSPT